MRGENVSSGDGGTTFDVVISNRKTGETRHIQGLKLAMYGLHNVLNALSAVAIASEMGLSDAVLNRAFSEFKWRQAALHAKPASSTAPPLLMITAITRSRSPPSCKAARSGDAKSASVAVVQPHRYSAAARACSTNSAPASTMPMR